MQCDICGKETDEIYVILVEGSKLNVCKECSHYGKIIEVKRKQTPTNNKGNDLPRRAMSKRKKEEKVYAINPDFAKIIRTKREKLGLKQKEFAKALSIKESLLHKIETSSFEPSLELARKLEKILNIRIVEEVHKDSTALSKKKKSVLTLGDMVKIKKRE